MRPGVLFGVSLIFLSACGSNAESERSVEGPVVVTSFYPLQFLAERIAGSAADITNLTAPGVEAHDQELTARQVASVKEADIVLYQQGFQPAVDAAVAQADRPASTTVDAAAIVSTTRADSVDDPHIWLDAANMAALAREVEATFAAADPENADHYEVSAATLIEELKGLHQAAIDRMGQCLSKDVITSHEAFGHFAEAYALDIIPIAGVDPSSEPSARQLSDLTEIVRSREISVIFTEELLNPAVANTLARETGATTATLDPIEGLSSPSSRDDYISLFEANLDAIADANDCDRPD